MSDHTQSVIDGLHDRLDEALGQNPNSIDVYKSFIEAFETSQKNRFLDDEDVVDLVHEKAAFTDLILQHVWSNFIPADLDASLIAVGGYGRGELHPASDVDLMILLAEKESEETSQQLEKLLIFLWDIRLEVGHSVRTLNECVREAEADITVATNIMESRLLAGSRSLFEKMNAKTGPDHIWPSDKFFTAKVAEQKARYAKYNDTAYNLEPNIKGNPGGLRDIQIIGWVAKRHFNANRLSDLVRHHFLTEAEYLTLKKSEKLLWKIRFALHIHSRRREDRLLFDHQRALATMLGYGDTSDNQAIEAFMQKYYRTVIELNRLNDILLQHFQEAILLKGKTPEAEKINERFQVVNGYIEVVSEQVFSKTPTALLEIFLLLAQNDDLKGVRASTIRLIRENLPLIDEDFRNDRQAQQMFLSLFHDGKGLTHELRRMNRYGVLAAYLPIFENIVGRMQYDLFHIYTVDEHTLFCVRNLRRLTVAEHHDEFPLCSDILDTVSMPQAVYLAALFHDIAKGRGGDHAELGAIDAEMFCKKHGLSTYETKLISWLVRKHLLMSMTAQRKDIDDPDVVLQFANQVADPDRLDYLYLLTVADARATNPDRWNDYKDSLLRQLYNSTRKALTRGLNKPQDQDDIIQTKQEYAQKALKELGFSYDEINDLWMNLSIDYFLHASPDEIVWQSQIVLDTPENQRPVIRIRRETKRGGTEIFVCTNDRSNVFAVMTILLAQQGLKILNARIYSTDEGCTMNSFLVHEQDGSYIGTDIRKNEIIEFLKKGLKNPDTANTTINSHIRRQLKHFASPARVYFTQDQNNNLTRMRLTATDKPGLLADISQVFIQQGIKIHSAKISTIGADVEDLFLITDQADKPITNNDKLAELEKETCEILDN